MAQRDVILNNLCGLQNSNFEVCDVKVFKDREEWYIRRKPNALPICNNCGLAYEFGHHSISTVEIIDQPSGRLKKIWKVSRAKIACPCTLSILVERLDFKADHHLMTKRFVDYIEELLCTKMFTVADIARMFDLDYGIPYKIDHQCLIRLIQHHVLELPENIAVDEKSSKKGHNYVTIVSDIDRGQAIWATEGNDKAALDLFFKVIGKEGCEKIKTVSKDLWKPYIESCNEYVPHATQTADKFHVIKRLSEAVDGVRKEIQNDKLLPSDIRANAKESMWIVRHKMENLNDYYLPKLAELEKTNAGLYRAYLQKELFFEFYKFLPSESEQARNFLLAWVNEARTINFEPLNNFCDYLIRHTEMILNAIITRTTSAFSEGINRKINVLKSMAYGYRSIHYFILKILQRCGTLGQNWKPVPQ
ncbi:MAG: ISL3 family transposase [bacterium]